MCGKVGSVNVGMGKGVSDIRNQNIDSLWTWEEIKNCKQNTENFWK